MKTEFLQWVFGAISFLGFSGVITLLGFYNKFVKRETTQNYKLATLEECIEEMKQEQVDLYKLVNLMSVVIVTQSTNLSHINEKTVECKALNASLSGKLVTLNVEFEKFKSATEVKVGLK